MRSLRLHCQSDLIDDYLVESELVNFSHPIIQEKVMKLFHSAQTDVEKARIAFEFVRDDIAHAWDIGASLVTCSASDVLANKQGICYAKSNLLAALLRSQGIPTGFCYQRLTLFDTPEQGYCIHALNAIFLAEENKWIRLDARGNKAGINAQFSIQEEKLAFPTREQLGEIDYPRIFADPNEKTIEVLKEYDDVSEMYLKGLPQYL